MKRSYTPHGWYSNAKTFSLMLRKAGITFSLLIAFAAMSYAQTPTYYQRVYADGQENQHGLLLSSVDNPTYAVDGNPSTASSLNVLLGIGNIAGHVSQTLKFSQPVPANTTVITKIEIGGGLLGVLSGITISTYYQGSQVGSPFSGSNLLTLLGGAGENEIAITRSSKVDAIKIDFGGINVASSIKIFDAYYQKTTTTPVCNSDPLDVLTGAIVSTANAAQFTGSVSNPYNAIDGDISTYATMNASTNLLGFTYETVVFSGYSMPGDTVRIALSKSTGLLDLGVIGNRLVVTTYKDFQRVDSLGGSSSLLNLQLLAGTSDIQILSFVPTGPINRIQIRFGGIASVLQTINLHEVTVVPPVPQINIGSVSVDGDTLSVCTDSTFTLSVNNPQAGTTYNWYDSTGTALQTGTSINVGPLSKGIHIYKVTAMRDACTTGSDTAQVVVNVTEPQTPVTTPASDTTICAGDTVVLQASSSQSGITFDWYDAATGGNKIRTGKDTIHVIPAATTTYYVEARSTGGGCTSATRAAITVTVNTLPQKPVISGPNSTICNGTVPTLSINSPVTGVTYEWFTDTLGTSIASGTSYTPATGLTDTTTYYVKATNGNGCVAAGVFSSFTVNVSPAVGTPTPQDQTITASIGDSVVFHVKDSAGVSFKWYSVATGGTPYPNTAASDTMFVTPIFTNAGTHTYYVEAVNADGCASPVRAKATAIISGPSGADCYVANQQYSPMESLLCVLCEVDNPDAAVDGDTTTYSNVRGNVTLLGNIAQELKFQHDGKAGDTLQLMLGSSTGLLDVGALNGVRIWFFKDKQTVQGPIELTHSLLNLQLLNTGTNKTTVQIVAPVDYDAIALGIGGLAVLLNSLYIYQAEQHIVMPTVTAGSVTICSGEKATLSATSNDPNNQVVWYDSVGTQVYVGDTYTTPALTDTTIYYVSAIRDGCANPNRIPVVVNVKPGAKASDITVTGPTGAICAGDTAVLQASSTTVTNPIFIWYSDANLTTPIDTINQLEVHPTVSTTYYVTVFGDGVCENAPGDAQQITVDVNKVFNPNTDITIAGDTAICSGTTTVLTASSSIAGATFMWYTDTTQAPVSTSSTFSVTPTDDTVYYVRVTAPGYCQSSALAVDVPVSGVTGASDIQITGNENGFCVGDTVTLKAVSTTVNNAVFSWYSDPGRTQLIHTGDTLMRPVTAAVSYYVSVTGDNACSAGPASGSKQVDVTVNPPATEGDITVTGTTTICVGDTATLLASSSTISAPIFIWYSDAGLTSPIDTAAQLSVHPATTTDYYVTVQGTNACENVATTGKKVTVTVNDLPQKPVISGPTSTICYGIVPTLSVNSAVTGITYEWFTDTLGTSIASGDSYTPATGLTDTTTYYVKATNSGGCVAAGTFASFTVNVSPAVGVPMPQEQTITASIGDSVVFHVKDSAGVSFKWYSTATGGTPLPNTSASDTMFVTPVFTSAGTHTYYVEAVNADGCASPVRAKATAIISGPSGANCYVANQQYSPMESLLCVLCEVDNPNAAVDGDTTTYSNVRGNVTLAGNIAQELKFQHDGKAGDTLQLMLGSSTGLLDVGALNGVRIWFFKDKQTVQGPIELTHSLLNLQLLNTGTNKTTVQIVAPVDYDAIALGIGGLAVLLKSLYIYQVEQHIVMPIVTTGSVTICSGEKATLSATSNDPNNQVVWYDSVGTQLHIGDTYTTSALTDTTIYYVSAIRDGCANPNRIPVVVNVKPGAKAVDIQVTGGGQAICSGDSILLTASSTTVTNPVFHWYSDQTLTDTLFTGAQFKVAPDSTTTYYVTVWGTSVCENAPGAAKEVTVTVNPHADSTDVDVTGGGKSNVICAGDTAVLSASSATVPNPVFNWYSDAQLTNKVFTGATYKVKLSQTTTYFVTVLGDGFCETLPGAADSVIVYVNKTTDSTDIDISGGGKNNAICAGESTVLSASSTTVTNPVFNWYSDAGMNTKVYTGASFTVSPAQTTTYYVTVLGNGFCETKAGAADSVIVYVNKTTDSTDIDITGGGKNNAICEGESTVLSASSATVTNPVFNWYSDAGLNTKVYTGASFTVSPTKTTTYYVTVMGDGFCETKADAADTVTVYVNKITDSTDIDITGGGQNNAICAGESTVLSASSATVTNPVFNWYSDAGLNTKVYTGASFTVSPAQTTTYYVTVMGDGFCETKADAADTVMVYVNKITDSTDIDISGGGKGNAICAGESTVLSASSTTVTNPVFNWYSDAGLNTKVYTGASFTVSPAQTTTYYVTVMGDGFCETKADAADTVTVYVNKTTDSTDIDIAGGGQNNTICEGESTVLSASSTTVTNPVFNWYSDAGLNTKVHTGASFTVSPTQTTTYYVTVMGDGFCETKADAADTVTVYVKPKSGPNDITISGNNGAICEGDEVSLQAGSTTVTNPVFNWYSDAALTNKVYTGATYKVSPTQTTTYYVTVMGDNKCENPANAAKEVKVVVNEAPDDLQVKGPSGEICAGTPATFTIENAQTGVTYNWYSDAGLTDQVHSGTTYTTGNLSATSTFYVVAVSNSGCSNASGGSSVTVTVSTPPAPPSVKVTTVAVCLGSKATFDIDNPETDVTYKWYSVSTGGTAIATGTSFTTGELQGDASFFVEGVSATGCASPQRTKVTATVIQAPVQPTITGPTGLICPGETATLIAFSPTANVTYHWFTTATGGTEIATGATYTTDPLNQTTDFYVEAQVSGGCVNSGGRTKITVTVTTPLPAPQVQVKETTATSVTFEWAPITGATAYKVSIDNGATWIDPSSGTTGTTHTVTGMQPDEEVTIIVKALGTVACQDSDPSVAVTGRSKNPLGDQVFIPNAFSPNSDGHNDVWKVYGNVIKDVHIMVFNEFGQKIFESRNMNDGWDGTYKGKQQPVGVYMYTAEITFNDNSTMKTSGSITLVR